MQGYTRCLFGSGEDAGTFEVNGSLALDKSEKNLPKVSLFTMSDAECWFPITDATLKASCKDYSYSFEDVDGKEHAFTGWQAAVLKAYSHAMESVRSFVRTEATRLYIAFRKGGKNRDAAIVAVRDALRKREPEFRNLLLEFVAFGGSARSGRRKIDENVLNSFKTLAEAQAYLREHGFVG